ncbi:MAG: helix-turn-helix transcriptional regulator [Acinetobacter sp.]|nr:helix-turn-helix transcriptional regulator [Acinetobacter sp.]
MNALTDIQFLHGADGQVAYAVLPIGTFEWLKREAKVEDGVATGIPADVAKLAILNDFSALRAWREHLGLTQCEVAQRLGISQSAYSQYENAKSLRKKTRLKVADVLGLRAEQLDF